MGIRDFISAPALGKNSKERVMRDGTADDDQ